MKFQNILSTILMLCIFTTTANAQLKIRNDEFIQIGYEDYRTLTFGTQTTFSPNNGLYAIEAYEGGLNFWKPWPNAQGYGNFALYLRPDRNAGIGTMGSSAYKLDVAGNVRGWSFILASDQRLKTNINPLTSSLDKILALDGVSYNYNFNLNNYENIDITKLSEVKQKSIEGDNTEGDPSKHLGLIAQEVQKIIPDVVKADEKGILGVNYIELIPLLIEATKEQQDYIEALQAEIAELKAAINDNKETTNDNVSTKTTYLLNNAPNPFTSETTIAYSVSEVDASATIHVNVYNQQGSLVLTKKVNNGVGKKVVTIHGSELKDNGTYFYSLVVNGQIIDSKMMLYVASE
jgi:hypothetical protein